MSCNIIENTLTEIEEQLGLKLKLYDGCLKKSFNNEIYFDIELEHSCWCSIDFSKLIFYTKKFKSFRVEQTGYKRVGIFLNNVINAKKINNHPDTARQRANCKG